MEKNQSVWQEKSVRNSKTGLIVITTLLACAVLVFTFYMTGMFQREEPVLTGTYCTGNGLSGEDQYYAFFADGTFALYQQYQMLAQGIYEHKQDPVYALTVQSGNRKDSQIVLNGDTVSGQDSDASEVIFTKMNNTPMLINVEL